MTDLKCNSASTWTLDGTFSIPRLPGRDYGASITTTVAIGGDIDRSDSTAYQVIDSLAPDDYGFTISFGGYGSALPDVPALSGGVTGYIVDANDALSPGSTRITGTVGAGGSVVRDPDGNIIGVGIEAETGYSPLSVEITIATYGFSIDLEDGTFTIFHNETTTTRLFPWAKDPSAKALDTSLNFVDGYGALNFDEAYFKDVGTLLSEGIYKTATGFGASLQTAAAIADDFLSGSLDPRISVRSALLERQGYTTRPDGGILDWTDVNGRIGTTNENSHYTKSLLDNYGLVDDRGFAKTTFGGTFRAIADALGFDGEWGIQGSYTREGEGKPFNDPEIESPTNEHSDGSSNSDDSNIGKWGGDRDNDGVPNHSDYNDGVGWRDKNKDGSGSSEGSGKPILLDLDDDGIEITELSKSTQFFDAGGDGLLHRTAWAGAGDGVLFIDDDGDGAISEKKEYVFTEWDPTATDDLAALRAVFDSNDDGVLDASDARFADFKLLVTNADGSTETKTLAELGITSINLTADTTRIELPDGSMITGQTTFTRTDGTTGTVANATLVAEAQGYHVDQMESTDAAGNRVVVSTAYTATGDIAYAITSVTSPDGANITNSYDDNGDGTINRLQEITTVTDSNGNKSETVVNKAGANAATALLVSRIVTTTSADGSDVTIQRDSTGGGWFDQEEIRSTLPDGSRSSVINDLAEDGSVIRGSSETTSVDGLTRSKGTDEDGDGLDDLSVSHSITEHADSSRTESTVARNQDLSLRSSETLLVGSDGQSKLISRDTDGDGVVETVEDLAITLGAGGDSTSVLDVKNADGSLRSTVTQTQSADALTKTALSDVDGDGDIDTTTVDATVIHGDGSRENTVTVTNTDGSVRSMQKTTLGADKISSETWVDLDQDGIFDADERLRSVTVDGATQARTTLDQTRAADGTVLASSTVVSSEDGLTRSSSTDADGDGDVDTSVSDITVVDGLGVSIRTIETRNQDGTLRSKSVTETSADGLTKTTRVDSDGNGAFDAQNVDTRVLELDGSITRKVSSYAGDGTTLLSRTTSTESADRLVMTTQSDVDGDAVTDVASTSMESADGSILATDVRTNADGSKIAASQTTISANGLFSSIARDLDGDDITDVTEESSTVLNADGSRTTTVMTKNGDTSLRNQSTVTVSDDGLTTTLHADADGNGIYERAETSTTGLAANGTKTTSTQNRSADTTLLSQSKIERSDDGFITETSTDTDGDGTFDLISTTTTTLQADGGTTTVSELRDAAGVLRNATTTMSNDNGRDVTTTTDVNGDSVDDRVTSRVIADDGVLTQTQSDFAADGTLQSRAETVTSANGLSTTVKADANGDGTFERTQQSTTTLNGNGSDGDGSRTTTTLEKSANGTAYRTSSATISDDGRTTTETWDYDADGTDDLTTLTTLDLSLDGIQTVTTERRSADAVLLNTSTTVTSADGRSVTQTTDVDGNGNADEIRVTQLNDVGITKVTESYFSSGGTQIASEQSSASADGLTRTYEIDRNGDGTAEHVVSDETTLAQDGGTMRVVAHETGRGVHLGREEYETSDDGLTRTSRLDVDGIAGFEFISEDTTTFEDDGDVVRQHIARNAASQLLADVTTTTSGNGSVTTISADYDGDGVVDRDTSLIRGAAGSYTGVTTEFSDAGLAQRQETRTQSADGWTTTSATDLDGDGNTDREIIATTDLSMNVNTIWRDLAADGTVLDEITGMVSANGMQRSVYLDVDGDGANDLMRTWTVAFDASGNEITTYQETAGNGVLADREVTTTSANGLSSVRTIDLDGDGIIDGTSTTNVTLNDDGSRKTVTETRYADGDLRSMEVVDVSRDSRTVTERHDYDGNGLADKTSELVIRADGQSVVTETSFGEGGQKTNTFVTTTSSDGLITTINRGGFVQTITRSAIDNGSYVWKKGDASAQTIVSHEIDAFGIETWRYANSTETYEVRLDQTAKTRVNEEAARIYDTVLDRDMDVAEAEILVKYVSDGQLDRASLISDLMNSSESAVRYGVLNDAEFITQFYLNAFGRAPSLGELNNHIRDLYSGAVPRDDLLLRLAESAEHLVVGNTHMVTNNFDVIMNPAQFERSLDRSYVEALVKKLVDVAYDRDATVNELEYYSAQLLQGSYNPDDLVAQMLATNGAIQGVSSVGLNTLSGAALVTQAFVNAFGRQPTTVEQQVWEENLSSGRIGKNQFVVALAQSTEKLEAGNAYETNPLPAVATQTGTAVAEILNGTAGQDYLEGLSGNDTLSGGDGSDILIGGTGDDILRGGAGIAAQTINGNDTYVWSRGDGNDRIEEYSNSFGETDTLRFMDVASDEVTLRRIDGTLDVEIEIISPGQSETIRVISQLNAINTMSQGIEVIEFSDGVFWDSNEIEANILTSGDSGSNIIGGTDAGDNINGLAGNDTLVGDAGDDILIGGTGDDILRGGTGTAAQTANGNDTYVWSKGDGNDTIQEYSSSVAEVDTLRFEDVASDDVALRRVNGTADIEIEILSTSEVIRVVSQLYAYQNQSQGLEVIAFNDSVVWSREDISENTMTNGTTDSDTLVGAQSGDNIYGLDGDDEISGGDGTIPLPIVFVKPQMHATANALVSYSYLASYSDLVTTLANDVGTARWHWNNYGRFEGRVVSFDALSYLASHDDLIAAYQTNSTLAASHYLQSGYYEGRQTNFDVLQYLKNYEDVRSIYSFDHVGATYHYITVGAAEGRVWQSATEDALTDAEYAKLYVIPSDGDDYLDGGAGNDTINGNAGDDTIVGGDGDDILRGGTDTAQAANGNDTYVWSTGDGDDTIEDLSDSSLEVDRLLLKDVAINDVVLERIEGTSDIYVEILSTGEKIRVVGQLFDEEIKSHGLENIEFGNGVTIARDDIAARLNTSGTDGDDLLNGSISDDHFHGRSGNDTIDGGEGNDTLFGGAGVDKLYGRAGADVLVGGDGNDTLYGHDGDDVNYGGDGNDYIFASSGNDTIYGGAGNDELRGGEGNDVHYGGDGNDYIVAWTGDDYVDGGAGDDLIKGGLGADTLIGGAGYDKVSYYDADSGVHVNLETGTGSFGEAAGDTLSGFERLNGSSFDDVLIGSAQNDDLYGYAGDDDVHGGDGHDFVFTSSGNDTIYGGAGNDELRGGEGNDVHYGGDGNDYIVAWTGDDLLDGGIGNDVLSGGVGSDVFVLKSGDGNDTITDFETGIDTIRFEGTGLGFADLTITDAAGDTVVDYGGADQIVLTDVTKSSVTADNFAFV